MFLLSSIRWFVTAFAFHSGLTYAAFIALRRPTEIETLKLWMLLSVITGTSYLLGDVVSLVIPMFLELRTILVWGILFIEPKGWADAYDKVCGPFLVSVVGALREASRSGYIKMISVRLVRLSLTLTSALVSAAASVDAVSNPDRVEALLEELQAELNGRKVSKAHAHSTIVKSSLL